MIELIDNRYGKHRVRLMKVTRHPEGNRVFEWTVEVLLRGDFETAHTLGDNSKILATDTMKNTVYSVARSSQATTMEEYARELIDFLLSRNPQVSSAHVRIQGHPWQRLEFEGQPHPDSFMRGSNEVQTTSVERHRDQLFVIHSGLSGLNLLKTANSAFSGFLRDSLTTLPETEDRVFGTIVEADWHYTDTTDYDLTRETIRTLLLRTFADHKSKSVQQTLYAMAEDALNAVPAIDEIHITMPNKHCLLVDLSRFGQDNPNEIFVPTDEPHGYIEARLRRS
ncbi:urate oxidase [Granulicella sp. WH15]|uniref:factor-independent urate hydroxylase n=1 Tax=Granulicella sp. WH15 TaxID=2602070 RepID=UPI00136725C1|nr:urate oxidase [Granulicella sp. WH15]QHN04271.1 urate oxidase [Granulicella sp. WH15]